MAKSLLENPSEPSVKFGCCGGAPIRQVGALWIANLARRAGFYQNFMPAREFFGYFLSAQKVAILYYIILNPPQSRNWAIKKADHLRSAFKTHYCVDWVTLFPKLHKSKPNRFGFEFRIDFFDCFHQVCLGIKTEATVQKIDQ